MKVPFINYPKAFQYHRSEYERAIIGCCERGDLVYRDDLVKFERDFAKFCGVRHCIGTGSCTNAMFISLKALGVGFGHEVITVSHTYVATIDVIVAAGALPVLVDIDPTTMNMDVNLLEKAVTPWTRAIMPVHLNGRMCDMDRIMEIAVKHRLFVIEDAAQAVGSTYYGKRAGAFGETGCFSFYPAKTLGCFGEGGAVVTDDERLASILYLLRDHCEWPRYIPDPTGGHKVIHGWGYNTILDNIQAAVLNVKMQYLDNAIKRRCEIAGMYEDGLHDIECGVRLPPPPSHWQYHDAFQNYVIQCKDRDTLKWHLEQNGIETLISWQTPNHKQPGLQFSLNLPVTEKVSAEVLSLPCYPELLDDEVAHVIKATRSFFK